MSPVRENVAYDFSMFEPKETVQEQPAAVKEARPVTKASASPAAVVKWVAVSMLVMLALLAIMVFDAQINTLSDSVSSAKQKLSAAQSEEIRLNMQLESRASLSTVEDYAVNKLGLQKIDQYQLHYVHFTDKDKVEVSAKDSNIITHLINLIMEYL